MGHGSSSALTIERPCGSVSDPWQRGGIIIIVIQDRDPDPQRLRRDRSGYLDRTDRHFTLENSQQWQNWTRGPREGENIVFRYPDENRQLFDPAVRLLVLG